MHELKEMPARVLAARTLRRAATLALDFLFPPLCQSCRARVRGSHALCAACWNRIAFIEGAMCTACGIPFDADPGGDTLCGACFAKPHDFGRARALLRYDDASKDLVLGFKPGDRLDRAPAFARWMERIGHTLLAEADLIVPVPLHRFRLWKWRYNQAAILALRLAKLSGVDCDPMVLERSRATPSQGQMMSANARRRNVLAAFKVPKGKLARIRARRILLVDDVFTTGVTLNACARALKRGGAARVDALTLARVVRAPVSDI